MSNWIQRMTRRNCKKRPKQSRLLQLQQLESRQLLAANLAPQLVPLPLFVHTDHPVTLSLATLHYSDMDGDPLSQLTVNALPDTGALQLDGLDVTVGQQIAGSDIQAGLLNFVPDPAQTQYSTQFTVTASDGQADSLPASFAVYVDIFRPIGGVWVPTGGVPSGPHGGNLDGSDDPPVYGPLVYDEPVYGPLVYDPLVNDPLVNNPTGGGLRPHGR